MPQVSPKDSLRQTIGSAAREARLHMGLTQEEVAERLGIATEVYGRLERGVIAPSISTLRKLCLTLYLSADKMLGTANTGEAIPAAEAAHPQPPDSRHMQRMLQRARKLPPQSLRLLSQLAVLLSKQAPTPAKPSQE
ncbi:helix-turn-helix domain-containing protein [Vitiosangium sp. GDMCC 1.1324]|uniref:helix-turn-helix domain-containing protein n=1 Tax=Vitiosangium sp. (strain GDMCC 1.1324) TaxID=2138576 RepID=UPI000D3CDC35|nr:helix-turn-helix transcriptional regulator [Vitiosangium sp. GDMCC 1.1324]PTL83096.1 transcriptional regulator [Vitiosangium sp. GDMCC 1.1324]